MKELRGRWPAGVHDGVGTPESCFWTDYECAKLRKQSVARAELQVLLLSFCHLCYLELGWKNQHNEAANKEKHLNLNMDQEQRRQRFLSLFFFIITQRILSQNRCIHCCGT